MNQEELRYPIGRFAGQENYSSEEIQGFIAQIESLPERLQKTITDLTEAQLDTPYREGGWTIRQLLHHLPDSHMNAYIRFKWTLTEETPTIKVYDEKAWAETAETKTDPTFSLALLKALHQKWVVLLRSLKETDLSRKLFHPQSQKHVRLNQLLNLYAWHGDHHLAHITQLKKRNGW